MIFTGPENYHSALTIRRKVNMIDAAQLHRMRNRAQIRKSLQDAGLSHRSLNQCLTKNQALSKPNRKVLLMFLGTHMHNKRTRSTSYKNTTLTMKILISQQDSVVTRLSKTALPVISKALTKILLTMMLKRKTNFVSYKKSLLSIRTISRSIRSYKILLKGQQTHNQKMKLKRKNQFQPQFPPSMINLRKFSHIVIFSQSNSNRQRTLQSASLLELRI